MKLKALFYNFLRLSLMLFFFYLLIASIIFHPFYLPDAPFFKLQTIESLAGVLSLLTGLLILYKRTDKVKVDKPTLVLVLLASFLVQILIISLLPLEPVSDMQFVYNSSLQLLWGNWFPFTPSSYLALNPSNAFYSLLLAGVQKITLTNILIPKLINIFSTELIIVTSYGIFRNVFKKDSLFVLLSLAFFPAAFFYANHIYSDVLSTALLMLGIYLSLGSAKFKTSKYLIVGLLFSLSTLLRQIGIFYYLALFFYILFSEEKKLKDIILLTLGFFVPIFIYYGVMQFILGHSLTAFGYPIWSWIYIGLNPDHFGFQDGTHNLNRSFGDITNRILSLGPLGLVSVIFKKEFWTWMEGTYQLQRYGIGYPQTSQYTYNTILTNLYGINIIAVFTSALSYSLNYLLIFFTWVFLLRKKHINNAVYFIMLTFAFYILFYAVWEIKSRYLYSLYPFLIILAYQGFQSMLMKNSD